MGWRETIRDLVTSRGDCPECGCPMDDGRCQFCEVVNERAALAREIERLRGVRNLLADKLGHYTGYPIPTEIREAEAAVAAGGDSWDNIRRCYVDDCGRKLKALGGE